MEKILVSACLLGARVRYHGGDASCDDPVLERWSREGRLVSTCPEVEGGLPTPRAAAEIEGGLGGEAVIRGLALVRTVDGQDKTGAFLGGARRALDTARLHDVRVAILKEGSPSCGSGFIYDGAFTGRRISEVGVTTAFLRAHGIKVFSEHELRQAQAWLDANEA